MENDFEEIHWRHIIGLAIALNVDPKKLCQAVNDTDAQIHYQGILVETLIDDLIGSVSRHTKKQTASKNP